MFLGETSTDSGPGFVLSPVLRTWFGCALARSSQINGSSELVLDERAILILTFLLYHRLLGFKVSLC